MNISVRGVFFITFDNKKQISNRNVLSERNNKVIV